MRMKKYLKKENTNLEKKIPMDPEIILLDRSKCKYFTRRYSNEFDV